MPDDIRRARRLRLFTEALALGASAWAVALFWHHHGAGWGVVALFAALVVASENLALHFPSQVAISPQLILIMAAIVALPPDGRVGGALLIGASGGLVWRSFRRRRYLVIAFNVAQFALAAGAGAGAYQVFARAGAPTPTRYAATVVAYMAVNTSLVMAGVAFKTGQPVRAIWSEVRASVVTDLVFGVLGLLLGRFYRAAGPVALLAIVGPAVIARTVFVSVTQFRQAYHRLDVLYAFTKHLERTRDEPDAVAAMLDEMRSLLHVDAAEVTVVTPDGWRRSTLLGTPLTPAIEAGRGVPPELQAAEGGPLLVSESDPASPLRVDLQRRGMADAMIAPLHSDTQLMGTVLVATPSNNRRLTADDLRLLETLAHHAAASLENSRLLGRLRFDSRHDLLTGLPNRARFTELLAGLDGPGAMLLIDLDRFKEINDTLGHTHGDDLLCRVAERITAELGDDGVVARLGGDEFGVLLPGTTSGDAAQAAVALLAALEAPFAIEELSLELTASIGVAVASDPDDDPGRLLQQADVAMYTAKEAHSGWEVYTPDRDHYSPQRLALAGELRRAIDRGDLEVHSQPKADLRTGAVCGLEALVRWRHPRYGLIGPDQFVPVAEHAGLIRPLTMLVLRTAAREHQELRSLGFDLGMAVNLSVRSVLDVNLPDQVAEVLTDHDMAASALTLEITESSVMADPSRTIGVLGRLSELGASISIDDFGTGYSSLTYLKRLPANEVKIDKSFVSGLLNSDSDAAIVRSTVDLARNLGLRTVAEGVEDGPTWTRLGALGCQQAQGYFLSPALPAPDLRRWLLRTQRIVDPTRY